MKYHEPVMSKELLSFLNVKPNMTFVDCTLGDGGHALQVLQLGASVIGLDVDDGSLSRATTRIKESGFGDKFSAIKGNFKDLEKLIKEKVNGIYFDLGYSSSQLEEDLGLSFLNNQPLDMRLDQNLDVKAADLVNALGEPQLKQLFWEYGGERMAGRFASAIVERRGLKKLQTTKDLADLLASVAPPGYEHGRIHPATRAFQALRIAVNDELGNLKSSLPQAARLLLPGGRMAVISFHSLEDRVVKDFGRNVQPSMIKSVTKKPLNPTDEEVTGNSRSRSAILRVFERV